MVKIFWDNVAKLELQVACNYIKKSSPLNAKKVAKEIKDFAKVIAKHPESHSLDKYKSDNKALSDILKAEKESNY